MKSLSFIEAQWSLVHLVEFSWTDFPWPYDGTARLEIVSALMKLESIRHLSLARKRTPSQVDILSMPVPALMFPFFLAFFPFHLSMAFSNSLHVCGFFSHSSSGSSWRRTKVMCLRRSIWMGTVSNAGCRMPMHLLLWKAS